MKSLIILLIGSIIFAAGQRVDLKYDYLRAGIAPRIQALGDTGIISATGPEGVYFNPALLMVDTDEYLLAGSTPLGYDQQQYFAYYRLPIAYRNALFSIGFVAHQVSDIEVRGASRTDTPLSIMSASDMMLVLGISRYLGPRTTFGMNVAWMFDNYSLTEQPGINFSFGLSHLFSEEVFASALLRYMGNGQFSAGTGVRLNVINDLTFYSSLDAAFSEGFSRFIIHNGMSWNVATGLDILFGYDGNNLSLGATQKLGGVGFQIGYTNAPLGSRYSFAIELH